MERAKRKRLPKREELEEKYTWDLTRIFPSIEAWEDAFKEVKASLPEVEKFKGRLGESAGNLLAALRFQDEISNKMGKVYTYAHLKHDEDTGNSTFQDLYDRAVSLDIELMSAFSFLIPEILAIPGERLEEFLQAEEELRLYRHYLDDLSRRRTHTLSPNEEYILAQVKELANSPSNIFSMLNNADLTFPMIHDEEGEEVELTKGRYIQFLQSKDRRVREEAFKTLYETYGKFKNTWAAAIQGEVKKNIFFARVRKFPSALEASLHRDHVPKEVYENLIETVHRNLDQMYRYVALRKKFLGVEELHMYDLYVPMVKEVEMRYSFDEAVDTVLKGLAPLGEEYLHLLQEGIKSRWIDVYENQGKRAGAYSSGTYGTPPYILLNYQDDLESLFTLSHELGHSMHSYYSRKYQPYIYARYSIFVAEVASTLNEALMNHYLLQRTKNKRERMYLINHHLEDFRTTVFRQTMFAEFEKWIHEQVERGEALNQEKLSRYYYDLNRKYFGDDIVVDREIAYEWTRIPHFYYNFYVYKYATGFSAATTLSQMILQEGKPAVDRYIQFLKMGGSDYPLNELKEAGVDMTSPEPIQKALDLFKNLLDQLEQLLEE
ncbi:oligoendopeptidase F [Thermicanus aegyptius]|uniref:oligoendopeptidase F n=1 Tax=Thermicanus aegyptius TaxID=94009 RepID=UPI0004921ACC|nr:oligoendopeptidase F [Thermicanus aegyptius]